MNRCPDRDTLLALLAGRGTVAHEVRSHVDECASCRGAMGRLLGVFYVAAAHEAFCSDASASESDDLFSGNLFSGNLFSGNVLSSDTLLTIFRSVDAAYRRRFEQQSEEDRARLEELERMVDLAITPTAPDDTISAMPSGLAESIFQNVDREYQRRFVDARPTVEHASADRSVWSRPVRWATAAAMLIAVGAGLLTSVDYLSNRGDPVVLNPQPENHTIVQDEPDKHDQPVETPDVVINAPDLQRLAFQWQDIERAQRQSLAFLQQRLSETVAVMNRLSSLGDDWRRYPDDTLVRARRAILKQDYEEADFWLQKRLLAIDLGVISEPRVPVLFARLECRRRQIDLERSENRTGQFDRLMEVYVELVEQIDPSQPAGDEKAHSYRARLHREAIQIAHLSAGNHRPAEVVAVLWPWRERLDADTQSMLAAARRDVDHQVDRLIGTGQLAATNKVKSWLQSRYYQISSAIGPGS